MPTLLISFEDAPENRLRFHFDSPMPLRNTLEQAGVSQPHPCGGRGVCRKCAAEIRGEVSEPDEAERRAGKRLTCRAVLLGNAEVLLPARENGLQAEKDPEEKTASYASGETGLLMAADIGTTTVAVTLLSGQGDPLASRVTINPQVSVAADVIGRIGYAEKNGAASQQEMILSCLDELRLGCLEDAGCPEGYVEHAVITGNTAMLYLLTGRNPSSLCRSPFRADCLFDITYSLPFTEAYLPPCFHAFAGADLMCAVLSSGMTRREEISLLCDIGTNGEIALWKDHTLYVTSAAAGPAFEGAGISCGMHSVNGAIDSVTLLNGQPFCHVIGDGKAKGLCGSGLIDAVSVLLDLGFIDETGLTEEDTRELRDGVTLTQADVRAVQLAKAAICAGIRALIRAAGCREEDIRRTCLAGGFGSRLNIRSAVRIGLIPEALSRNVTVLGNAALQGAREMLTCPILREEARELLRCSSRCDLGGDPAFNELYIDNISFE